MAKKSAKNKKALRRKQEARKRSRVVRQDYTVGGRVKAFNGVPDGVQEALDAGKRAEEEARRLQEAQEEVIPEEVIPEEVIPEEVTPEGRREASKPEQQVLNFGTRYDGKEFTSGNYDRISKDGGDPNQDKVITNDEWVNWMLTKGPDEGVSEQGIPFETLWTEKLTEASKQGDLTDVTRERLNQKLGVSGIPYVDNRLSEINDPDNKGRLFNDTADNLITKTVNDDLGQLKVIGDETLNFNAQENSILELNMSRWSSSSANARPSPFIEMYNDSGVGPGSSTTSISPAYTSWRSKKASHYNDIVKKIVSLAKVKDGEEIDGRRILPVSGTEFSRQTKVPYKIPAASADKVEAIPVSKVAVDDTTEADALKIDRFERDADGNIQFDEAGNPIRALRDVAALPDLEVSLEDDIDPDTVESTERQLTDPSKVAKNAELLGVDPKAARGFLVAEANYFKVTL